MWTYEQRTGILTRDGAYVDTGYAGNGLGLNNPDMDGHEKVGPLPKGTYTISGMILNGRHMGPNVMYLTPNPENDMKGRSAFYIHGDNTKGDNSASEGCIIMNRATRFLIAQSGDTELNVVSGEQT